MSSLASVLESHAWWWRGDNNNYHRNSSDDGATILSALNKHFAEFSYINGYQLSELDVIVSELLIDRIIETEN